MKLMLSELRDLISEYLLNEEGLKCPACGSALRANVSFCTKCGKQVKCDECGNSLRSGVHFCTKCGKQISKPIARPVDGLRVGDTIVHPVVKKLVKVTKILNLGPRTMIFFQTSPPLNMQNSAKVWLLV